jgi:hypothetical protein
MIRTEKLTINGEEFIHTYSDNGLQVERDGDVYDEAYDPIDSNRTYNEVPKDETE